MKVAKKRSDRRWEQHNYLVDEINPRLKNATYIAVLWVCFRNGRGLGYFRASSNRIAKCARTSKRNVQRILDDFESWRIIELIEEHKGPIPRTYRIRFEYVKDRLAIIHNIQAGATSGKEKTKAR
jgi:two-component sensor histidine kinase